MPLDASFHALNRYTCREVLDILRRGPQSVSEIHSQVKVGSRANVSQAIALLLKAEMVSMRRQGRNSIYRLRPAQFRELARYFKGLAHDARRSKDS
jgi:DNA-binding transcriptional ArsR family regulator